MLQRRHQVCKTVLLHACDRSFEHFRELVARIRWHPLNGQSRGRTVSGCASRISATSSRILRWQDVTSKRQVPPARQNNSKLIARIDGHVNAAPTDVKNVGSVIRVRYRISCLGQFKYPILTFWYLTPFGSQFRKGPEVPTPGPFPNAPRPLRKVTITNMKTMLGWIKW
jgi:hypothetical protein